MDDGGKVIARIKGGLGNQLFCYAAARRLALANDAELVIDDVTGFARDRLYRRTYLLDGFRIPCRKATPAERLEPFERARRAVAKWINRRRPFHERSYLEQEGLDFDARVLDYKVKGTVYLDGLWQSEGYFKEVEDVIRKDLEIGPPQDEAARQLAAQIRGMNAVAIHVRWFDLPNAGPSAYNLPAAYYQRAMAEIERRVESPAYVLFSDEPGAATSLLGLPPDRLLVVGDVVKDADPVTELGLMAQCRHFIIANSTFSWWGAWLGEKLGSVVIAPAVRVVGKTAWGVRGLLPGRWVTV
ncbi:alpha-1,2-fucosyltransferase [Nitrospira calida]